MKGKISILLVFILLFSFTMTAYADIKDITDITDFEKLREYIKNSKGQSDFISKEDKTYFRHKYWETVLPDYSKADYKGKPISINHDSVDNFKIFVYGEASMIPDNTTDKSGHVNYIGYTADGRKVVNLNVNEDKMKNPKLVPIDKYDNPSVKYYGNVRPFKTDYTNFKKVGEMYLGAEASDKDKEAYGRAVVTEWMKNMRVRETGFRDDLIGQGFDKVFSSVDEFVKYVAITSPPTSRSNGQATIWFEHDAGTYYNPETGKYATRRTFLIQQTDPINFKATEYTWNEETKMLNVKYEIEGIEKVDGIVEHVITQDLFPYVYGNFTTSKVKGFPEYFKDEYKEHNGEYIYLSLHDGNKWNVGIIEHRGGDMWDYFTLETQQIKPALENGKIKRNYEVNFNLGYLADYREEDIELDVRANLFTGDVHTGKDALGGDALGFPEYHDGAFYDNHIKVIIPATRLDFDLKHEDGEESRVFKIKDGVDAKIPVVAKLYNLEIEEGIESVVTNINLYDEKGNWIDTLDDLEFHKDGLEDGVVIQDIIIELKKEDLKPGKNVFYAVINSDFDLTEATPVEKEKNLDGELAYDKLMEKIEYNFRFVIINIKRK